MAERIGDLTMQELEQIVNRLIDKSSVRNGITYREQGSRDISVWENLRRNIIPRTPGAPSVGEMLREDRDR